ncbi:hypothetical protein [Spirochaeta cellobiosiphila]|uniref:hypothetical protein n=1 Tax=Spirochaeta cellobiosiphila TaxID=504483 RepID=UPI000422FAB8|nr:hypothetical protein [Spirochaeta cellobiosiphila]
MNSNAETTEKLKKMLQELHTRSDLKFSFYDLGKPASDTVLAEKKDSIPSSLLDFYSVMNGCDVLASFVNDSTLQLGLRIPPIENIDGFTEPDECYNFNSGEKIITLEWIEITMSTFFFILDEGETDISKAYIVSAYAGEEHESSFIAHTMGEFLEKAMEGVLTLGWACDIEETNSSVASIKKLLSEKPQKKTLFEEGDRVVRRQHDYERGAVIKAVKTPHSHVYYGDEYVLVDFDYRGTFWVRPDSIKKRPKKKDLYERALADPDSFVKDLLLISAEESASLLYRIGSVFCVFYRNEEIESIHYPEHSLRYAGIFNRVSFTRAVDTLIAIMHRWAHARQEEATVSFVKDGSEYNRRDQYLKDSDSFYYSDVIETALGCLTYLIMRRKAGKKVQSLLKDSQRSSLFELFDILKQPLQSKYSGRFSNGFENLLDSYDQFLSLESVGNNNLNLGIKREEWLDKLKLARPYSFWY